MRLSDIANTKLGPVIIYHENNTELGCPSKDNYHLPPPVYDCDVKPNMTASSNDFSSVNFTNALSIDKDMFLRVKISVSEKVKGLDKLVLDLRCFKPDRLFLLVEGSIEVTIAFEGVCQNDVQPRNDGLCKDTKSCPKDSLCTKVVNADQRCVANDDQLLALIPSQGQEIKFLCKFESCLQKKLRDPNNTCLSDWNSKYGCFYLHCFYSDSDFIFYEFTPQIKAERSELRTTPCTLTPWISSIFKNKENCF